MAVNVFSHNGVYLLNSLIFGWSYSVFYCDRPGFLLPDKCLFRKYSCCVIYYVAGLILKMMSQAKTIVKYEGQIYFDLFLAHPVDANVAAESTLSARLIEKRNMKRGVKIYCKNNYLEIICVVESTYLNNLILKMLMWYARGNLVHAIKGHLLKDKLVFRNFMKSCRNNTVNSEEGSRNIIKYILK